MTQSDEGLTLADYAEAKRLPLDFLKSLELSEFTRHGRPAVRIPYLDVEGKETAVRHRLRLKKGEDGADLRFLWKKGSKPTLYGLWRLAQAREAGYLVLVEGESDCHTLWHHGFPALGLPGAGLYREQRDAAHFEDASIIYVVIEPDAGGEQALAWLSRASIADRVKLVRLEEDVSALHLDDSERFAERFDQALRAAVPWSEHERVQRELAARRDFALCGDLARSSNILDRFFWDLDNAGYAGDERTAKLLYLAHTSRLLDRPVNLVVKGPSSAGKSHALKQILGFFPESSAHVLSGMSERSLAYGEEPIAHKHIVLFEEDGLAATDFGAYLIRSLLSEQCVRYETVEKGEDGRQQVRLIEREGPTGLITTTTKIALEAQLETRFLTVSIEDTPEHVTTVLYAIAAAAEHGGAQEPDYERWHALQSWLAGGETRVVIPYARDLVRLIPPVALRLLRDVGQLFALVSAHALLYREQRARDEQGAIVATPRDYEAVRDLVLNIFAEGTGADVSKATRELVAAVDGLASQYPDGVTQRALAEHLKLDRKAVQRRVRVALDEGYLGNREEKQGKASRLEVGDDLPAEGSVTLLPTAKQVVLASPGARQTLADVEEARAAAEAVLAEARQGVGQTGTEGVSQFDPASVNGLRDTGTPGRRFPGEQNPPSPSDELADREPGWLMRSIEADDAREETDDKEDE